MHPILQFVLLFAALMGAVVFLSTCRVWKYIEPERWDETNRRY